MLKRFIHAVIAALRTVSLRWEPLPTQRTVVMPRPTWDDGTNYDVPAYLRLRRRAG